MNIEVVASGGAIQIEVAPASLQRGFLKRIWDAISRAIQAVVHFVARLLCCCKSRPQAQKTVLAQSVPPQPRTVPRRSRTGASYKGTLGLDDVGGERVILYCGGELTQRLWDAISAGFDFSTPGEAERLIDDSLRLGAEKAKGKETNMQKVFPRIVPVVVEGLKGMKRLDQLQCLEGAAFLRPERMIAAVAQTGTQYRLFLVDARKKNVRWYCCDPHTAKVSLNISGGVAGAYHALRKDVPGESFDQMHPVIVKV